MEIVTVHQLKKYFGKGEAQVKALDGIDLSIEKGRFTAIIGASGSGKTTILNILSTIDTMSEGQILYDGTDISGMNEEELSDFRQKNLGFVFQDYNLLDTLTVEENIMLSMILNHEKRTEIERRIKEIAETLRIDDILDKFPYEVSGGQKQRAACARALVNKPKLILADEPTGALDSKSSAMLLRTLQVMNKELGATILMVTHDVFSACYCERILFLRDGKISAELYRKDMDKRDYLNRILDMQSEMGSEDIYAE